MCSFDLRLLDVFLRQKMWAAIEEAGSRFPNEVAMHPILLYGVAQAQAKQGKADQAEATAGKASKLFPGKSEAVLEQHVQIAGYLWRRGLPAWAEQECRHVISNTEKPQAVRRSARQLLAAMFQERGQDLKAAEELGEVVEVLRQAAPRPSGLRAESLPVMTAQMHHLYACHWLAQGDAAKHGEHLDKALAADPTHVDVLIACYRRADARPEYRRKVQEAIDACVAKMRGDVARNPGYPTTYNDLAWLVSNTEGDLDEALRFSRKSLELSPDNSSFYDTLGRVYHARGDHANALKYQTRAAELNPHSVQIARQLELFRKAQAAKGK